MQSDTIAKVKHQPALSRQRVAARLMAALLVVLGACRYASAGGVIKTAPAATAPGAPADGNYTVCPAKLSDSTQGDGGDANVICAESLMDSHEVGDIFGRRIAKMYLVVQVNVRNSSHDYDYLLQAVRLGYGGIAVTSRDSNLVRGVAEKGQMLDYRNEVVRGVEALGTMGGSLSTFSFATAAFKNTFNVFQGPFTSALKGFLPDYTIAQMNRLNDSAFDARTTVIPKNSATIVVVFLSKHVFLDPNQRKALALPLFGEKSSNEDSVLLQLQQKLYVEVIGAHVSEVKSNQPAVARINPASGKAGQENFTMELTGANLDRAAKVRIGDDGQNSASGLLELVQHDPAWAEVKIAKLPAAPGTYHLYLETAEGGRVDSKQEFIIANPAQR
jgi:hypothetical protein